MKGRFQILRMEPGKDRWEFVAHGAVWGPEEDASELIANMEARGARVRLVAVPKPRRN